MAEEFRITGSNATFKVRSPVWVGVWSVLTIGIYAIVWVYKIAREQSEYGKARGYDLGQNPTNTGLAVFPGGLIIVPALIALWRLTKRVQQAQRVAGCSDTLNGWIALILYILISPVYYAYMQYELNKVWAAEGGPSGDSGATMPARLPEAAPPAPPAPAAPAPESVGGFEPPVPPNTLPPQDPPAS